MTVPRNLHCLYPPLETKSPHLSPRVSLIQHLQLGKSSAYQPGNLALESRLLGIPTQESASTSSMHDTSGTDDSITQVVEKEDRIDDHFLSARARDRVVCPFPRCKKVLCRKSYLPAHLNYHTRARPFRCREANCQRRFRWKSNLLRHITRVH